MSDRTTIVDKSIQQLRCTVFLKNKKTIQYEEHDENIYYPDKPTKTIAIVSCAGPSN